GLGAGGGGGGELGAGGAAPAVNGVHLQAGGTQRKLPGELVGHRVVQVRVEVGQEPEPRRVVLDDRQQVLGRLDAGHLRAVLAQQEGVVDPLGFHQVIERLGDDRAAGVVHRLPARLPVPAGPVPPGGPERPHAGRGGGGRPEHYA